MCFLPESLPTSDTVVRLYLQETLTFLKLTKEAALALARGKHRPADDKAHSTDCAPLWGSPVRKSSCCARRSHRPKRRRVALRASV